MVIEAARPNAPSRRAPDIDHDVDTIVLKALAHEPDRRYATATELAEDIQRYLEGYPIHAVPDSSGYRIRKGIERGARRHPWSGTLLAGLVAVIAGVVLFRSGFLIRVPDRYFESLALQWVPTPSSDAWCPDVKVIGLDDATYESLALLASTEQLESVSVENLYSWRLLHGALMHRLAEASPRAVVWDIYFKSAQPAFDPALVEGIRAVKKSGAKVILGANAVDASGEPVLSPAVAAQADGWGWIHLQQTGDFDCVRGTGLLVAQPPRPPTPSLSLAAFALVQHGDASPHYEWETHMPAMRVRYFRRNADSTGGVDWLPQVDEIPISDVVEGWPEGIPRGTDPSERKFAICSTCVAEDPTLAQHTVSYREVFRQDAAWIRERFADKIVLIGDQRLTTRREPDMARLCEPGRDRTVFSSSIHAAAIGHLVNRQNKGMPNVGTFLLVVLACAAAGAALGVWAPDRAHRLRFVLGLILLSSIVIAVAFVLAVKTSGVLGPSSLIASLCLAAVGASWVRRQGQQRKVSV
jgi:CHASE2 domain-containing sensor protein